MSKNIIISLLLTFSVTSYADTDHYSDDFSKLEIRGEINDQGTMKLIECHLVLQETIETNVVKGFTRYNNVVKGFTRYYLCEDQTSRVRHWLLEIDDEQE